MAWKIIARPQGANKSASADTAENKGGLVILLKDAGGTFGEQEVSRVAFERKNSANPRVPFETQLDKEVGKAKKALALLNTDLMGDGTLQ